MSAAHVKQLGQYLTPVWAAEALVERHFADLSASDVVLEPTCGAGAFLGAIPSHVHAIGVEIDPLLAEQAKLNTGRQVIVGDFCTVPLDVEPTVVIGNPPFKLGVIDKILDRAHYMLPEGGRVGLILPSFSFQTAGRVMRYSESWSIMQEMIPRNIFTGGLSKPLVFALFSKDKQRKLFGFALYHEARDVQQLPKDYREYIQAGGGPVWLNAILAVLKKLGGMAELQAIYKEFEGKRPTETKFWREQIRKVLRQYQDVFLRKGEGVYALAASAS